MRLENVSKTTLPPCFASQQLGTSLCIAKSSNHRGLILQLHTVPVSHRSRSNRTLVRADAGEVPDRLEQKWKRESTPRAV